MVTTAFQSGAPRLTRRDVLRGSATALAALSAPRISRSAPIARLLKLGYTLPHDSHYGAAGDEFSRQVTALTDGGWQIEQHPNGFLGGELEMIENLRKGQLDLVIVYTGGLSTAVPELGIFDLPFMFRDATHACTVLDGPVGDAYLASMRRHDMIGLAWGENGMRHMTNSRQPIHVPEDLRGLKFRVPQTEVLLRCFRQLGADAAPLSFTALYGALESGRFQGQENPIPTIRAARLDRVQRYLTLSAHTYAATLFVMSRDCWDDLGDEERRVFTKAARDGGQASRDAVRRTEKIALNGMLAQGNEIVESIDQEEFRAALGPLWAEIAEHFGRQTVDRIRSTS